MVQRVYLDYNATTPVDASVLAALLPYLSESFGNASSSYPLGVDAKRAVETARAQVAHMLGTATDPSEIVFLSGGTESINYALKGSADAARTQSGRNHIITSVAEHVAVLETCRYLETQGFRVTYLDVDDGGRTRVEDVVAAVTPATCVVSIMHANNEVGTLNPIAAIAAALQQCVRDQHLSLPIVFHTDASQSIGKVPVDVDALGVDLLTIAGHKLYAPKGIGALYIRNGTVLPSTLLHGASHESKRRAGTENVPFIVALGAACALIDQHLDAIATHMQAIKTALFEQLQQRLAALEATNDVAMRVNGDCEFVLPNTLSVSFSGINAVDLLALLEADGVCASAGSACHSHSSNLEGDVTISHVLAAMRVPQAFARGTLRLSVGRNTTLADVDAAATAIQKALEQLVHK